MHFYYFFLLNCQTFIIIPINIVSYTYILSILLKDTLIYFSIHPQ